MAIDEATRHRLHTVLEETLGPDESSTLMSLLPPVGWADVATTSQLLGVETALRTELHAVESAIRGDMRAMESSIRGDMQAMGASLRGEFHQGMAALEVRLTGAMRQQLFALIAAMFSISTLTVVAAAVFGS